MLNITRPVDYETEPTSYTIDIEVTDGITTPDVQTVTITIGPVNEAPAIPGGQTFTVVENEAGTTVLHTLATTDVDSGDSIGSYVITGGTGASLFSIDASGDIRRTGTLDYNTEQAYTLDVTATDVGGLPATGTVTVDVKSRLGDLSPYYGQVLFNEVIYRDSGFLWTATEIINVAGAPISTVGWQITDHELGVAPTEPLWTSLTVGAPSIQPGEISASISIPSADQTRSQSTTTSGSGMTPDSWSPTWRGVTKPRRAPRSRHARRSTNGTFGRPTSNSHSGLPPMDSRSAARPTETQRSPATAGKPTTSDDAQGQVSRRSPDNRCIADSHDQYR